jgi:hypothetical protein
VPVSAVIALLRTHHRFHSKKLKIGFFANLLILIIAIPSYLYIGSLLPKPANFQMSNMVFDQKRFNSEHL